MTGTNSEVSDVANLVAKIPVKKSYPYFRPLEKHVQAER